MFRFRLIFSDILLLIPPILFAPAAKSMPDFIRKGYTSCISCHVSPTGGGVLTGYGRGWSEELFLFGWEGAGSFAGWSGFDEWKEPTGLFQTLKADLQADYRSVTFEQFGAKGGGRQTIPMQLDASVAFHIGKTTDLVASYGKYGPDESLESRVHYLQVRTSKFLSFRAGRFLPGYGLNIDDHTAWIRSGLGFSQGHESLNIEAHYEDEIGMTTFTRIMGETVQITESNQAFSFESEQRQAFAIRSALKVGSRHTFGVSGYHEKKRRSYGIFGASSPIRDWLYILGELDGTMARNDSGRTTDERYLAFLRIGSGIYRGVALGTDLQFERASQLPRERYSLWSQLILVPYLELRLEGRREGEITTGLVMVHAWL